MTDKKFIIALIIVLAVCVVATFCLTFYTVHLHNNCSILAFIANER